MLKYYKKLCWEAFKGLFTKGPIIFGLIKVFIIFGLPAAIGSIAVQNIWTATGFKSNWYWVVGPLLIIVLLFWFIEALLINYKNVEIVRPDLLIEYNEGEPDYQQWDPSESSHQYLLHRISIYNKGQKPVSNIKAQIFSVEPRPAELRGLPQDLHIMNRNSSQNIHDPICDIVGREKKFFDLIYIPNKVLGRRGNMIIIPASQNEQKFAVKSYKIEIHVFAGGNLYGKVNCELIEDTQSKVNYKFEVENVTIMQDSL